MSKSTRHADNSKRQQPTKQAQRAQARQPGSSGPVKSEANEQQQKPEKKSDAARQR